MYSLKDFLLKIFFTVTLSVHLISYGLAFDPYQKNLDINKLSCADFSTLAWMNGDGNPSWEAEAIFHWLDGHFSSKKVFSPALIAKTRSEMLIKCASSENKSLYLADIYPSIHQTAVMLWSQYSHQVVALEFESKAIDLNKITCAMHVSFSNTEDKEKIKPDVGLAAIWLIGHQNKERTQAIVNLSALKSMAYFVEINCGNYPSRSFISVVNQAQKVVLEVQKFLEDTLKTNP